MRGAASAHDADAIMMVAARRDSLDIPFPIVGTACAVLVLDRNAHVALLFRFEVMPCFGVVAADDGDRIGALFQRHEGVDFGGLRHDRDVAGLQFAIVDDREVGIAFLAAVVLALVHGVLEAPLVDCERFPHAVIVRRDAFALWEFVERDDELAIVIEVLRVIDVIALPLDAERQQIGLRDNPLQRTLQRLHQSGVVVFVLLDDVHDVERALAHDLFTVRGGHCVSRPGYFLTGG